MSFGFLATVLNVIVLATIKVATLSSSSPTSSSSSLSSSRDCPLHHSEQQQAARRACLPASGQRQRVQHRHLNICQAYVRHTLRVTN